MINRPRHQMFRMRMPLALLVIWTIAFACGDHRRTGPEDQIESFDISADDRHILMLHSLRGATDIFEMNTAGGTPRRILKAPANEIWSNPRYAPDGKKMVFIKRFKNKFWEGLVIMCNVDGTEMEELTHGGEFVTEAIFSAYGHEILFCSAQQYNTSKKKGTTTVRGFDIYALNLSDRQVTRLSMLNVDGIDNLTEINDQYLLFHVRGGKKSGVFSFEKKNPTRVLRIFPYNGTVESQVLDKPGFVPDRFIAFTAQNELFLMNLDTRENKLIYDAQGGHLIELLKGFHHKAGLLFKKFDETTFTQLNADGTGATTIAVEFPQ